MDLSLFRAWRLISPGATQTWIDDVAEPVSQEVYREDHYGYDCAGEDHHPTLCVDVFPAQF